MVSGVRFNVMVSGVRFNVMVSGVRFNVMVSGVRYANASRTTPEQRAASTRDEGR